MTTAESPLTYQQTPRPIGAPVTYRLKGDRLQVEGLRTDHDLPLSEVVHVRLTYEAGRMSGGFFRTRLRLRDGRTVTLTSLSWAGTLRSIQQTPAYGRFVAALLAAVRRANPDAVMEAGKPALQWGGMALVAVAISVAVFWLVARALAGGSTVTAAFGLMLGMLMVWQIGPLLRLNRPRPIEASNPPAELLG